MSSKLSFSTSYELPHSPHSPKTRIPALGFGVYKSAPEVCVNTVKTALATGYRHLDTAQFYENETEVGEGVRASGVPRGDIFIVTKVMRPSGSVAQTLESLRESVRKIAGGKGKWEGGDGYVDLFLIHTPSSGPDGRKEMWTALEQLRDEGGTREIGVSNYGIEHLKQTLAYAKHAPVINQLELHPFCPQPALTAFCKEQGILCQAYSPLVRATKNDDPVLTKIADKHGVSVPQVLVRWGLQMGWLPLPKSDTESRIKTNADVFGFELDADDMDKIKALGKGLEDGEGAICPYNVHCP